MTIKGSEILNKLIGAGLLVASMGFFADVGHTAEYFVPGLIFAAGGFLLALRRDRRPAVELEGQQRLDQLAEGLAATQAEVSGLQERLDRLADERDFMRQLGPAGVRAPLVAAPPGESVATADAATRI